MEVTDICFIGSGIATSLTLIEVCNNLLGAASALSKKHITVVEKYRELWKGIPYGSRSSVNALTITCAGEFINEQEWPAFFSWLKGSAGEWAPWYREQGGITAARWLDNNLPLLENEDWETLYMPRFLYGNYLQQKVTRLLKQVEERGCGEINTITAEAIEICKDENGIYEITLEHPDASLSKIGARKAVISTGSAPVRKMCEINTDKAIYVNDIYDPSVSENIKTVAAALREPGSEADRNILIIGSNASGIELLYLLEGMPELRELIHKTVIISPSGLLPYHISTEVLEHHRIPHLDKLKEEGNYTLQALVDAAAGDIQLAVQNGANMDYVATIVSTTLKLMEPLGDGAKKEFYAIHALRLRNRFRRSGPEYKRGSQLLIDAEEAVLLKGKFLSTVPSENGVHLHYTDADNSEKTYPLTFKVVVNCSGSDDLDQSSSRLLYNLISKQMCQMNLSRKGVEVNEKFEAAPNLYVMGPLLGGNMNKLIHFWQLENASRLTYLAPFLAKELVTF